MQTAKMAAKDFLKNRVFHPLFKISNMATFLFLMFSAIVLYLIGAKVISGIIVGIASLFIIFNKLENIEARLRNLEGG